MYCLAQICMKICNYRGVTLFVNFNCNLSLKQIITLTFSNMPAGLYFVLKHFSFTFSMHLEYIDTRS